jgi:hypothetical protein
VDRSKLNDHAASARIVECVGELFIAGHVRSSPAEAGHYVRAYARRTLNLLFTLHFPL